MYKNNFRSVAKELFLATEGFLSTYRDQRPVPFQEGIHHYFYSF